MTNKEIADNARAKLAEFMKSLREAEKAGLQIEINHCCLVTTITGEKTNTIQMKIFEEIK